MFYELHYTLNGQTESVSGLFSTHENAQRYLDENPSLRGSYVAEVEYRKDGKHVAK